MTSIIDPQAIGAEVSWSFGDGDSEAVTLDRARIIELFSTYGFDVEKELEMSPDSAIRRAARYVKQTQNVVVREFAKPNKDTPRSYGVYKRVANEGEGGDEWQCHGRVRVQGDAIAALSPEGDYEHDLDEDVVDVARDMARMANKVLSEVMNVDISKALTNVGKDWGWVSRRRNAGGVYFIPSGDFANNFVRLLQALADETAEKPRWEQFVPQAQETYPKPLTLASWRGSAADAFASDLEAIKKKLQKVFVKGEMSDKVLERRADECTALIKKAGLFKSILANLPEVVEVAEGLKAAYDAALEKGIKEAAAEFSALGLDDKKPEPEAEPSDEDIFDLDKPVRRQVEVEDF